MKNIALAVLLVFSSVLAAAPVELVAPESVGMSSERLVVLKNRLQRELDTGVTGGIQVLISRRGKVVMHENLGFANIEENKPITDDSLFRIYSMTKPIVGTAMMMLYEEGVFSMDDPVAKHIPEFADLQVYAGVDDDGNIILENPVRKPTIHDLMQHTAGFTYGVFGDTPVDTMYRQTGVLNYDSSSQEMIDKLAAIPLLYQPGERWVYSVAVDIQGFLIERWTGQDLGEFLQERLFDPLGMDQTMTWASPEMARMLADVHTHVDGSLAVDSTPVSTNSLRAPGHFAGGGQLLSTSDDYWRFAQMLLNKGEFDGRRYLAPSSVEMMSADRLPFPFVGLYGEIGFGLNFAVIDDPVKVAYPASAGEYFWAGVVTTLFWIDPAEELVVVMLTQYTPFNEPYFRDIMHRMVHAAIIE